MNDFLLVLGINYQLFYVIMKNSNEKSDKLYFLLKKKMGQPLILTLMKFPIILLNYTINISGTLFYAPSYIVFLLLKDLIFNQYYKSTLRLYCFTWLFRLVGILLGFGIFIAQFYYFNYYIVLLSIQEMSKYILIASLLITNIGLLYLMRRGYLKALVTLNVPQLKSPKQHIIEFLQLLQDIPSIILVILNIMLVSNASKTFDFQYDDKNRMYLQHISEKVREAFFYDLQLFVVMELKIFSWRYKSSVELEQQKNNNSYRLIILILIWLNTNVDIIVFVLVGWFPFLSIFKTYKRYIRLFEEGKAEYYRNYAIKYFLLVLTQYLILIGICLVFILAYEFKKAIKYFKILRDMKKKQNYNLKPLSKQHYDDLIQPKEFHMLLTTIYYIVLSLLEILAAPFHVIVHFTVYKNKKLKKRISQLTENFLIKIEKQKNPRKIEQLQEKYELQDIFLTLTYSVVYCFEFMIDIPFFLLLVITVIICPQSYKKFKNIIDENHDLKKGQIFDNFKEALLFLVVFIIALILIPLYFHRIPWLLKEIRHQSLKQQIKYVAVLKKLIQLFKLIIMDIPFLPLYYFTVTIGMLIYSPQKRIYKQKLNKLIVLLYEANNELISLLYQFRLRLTGAHKKYREIYQKDSANGFIKTAYNRRIFWSTSSSTKSLQTQVKILSLYIKITYFKKKSFERKVQTINNTVIDSDISEISKIYWKNRKIREIAISICINISIQIMIGLFALLVILPLVSWRFPTLIYIIRKQKWFNLICKKQKQPLSYKYLRVLMFVFFQNLLDLTMIPSYVLTFFVCPVKFVKYCIKYAYNYSEEYYEGDDLTEYFTIKRRYFYNEIFVKSMKNFMYLFELVVVAITVIRLNFFINLLKKAKYSLLTFFMDFLGLNPLSTIQQCIAEAKYMVEDKKRLAQVRQDVIRKISLQTCIYVSFRELIKDIPFFFLSILILIMFPWRVNYLFNILKEQHTRLPIISINGRVNVVGRRKQIIELMLNILKTDYLCIFLNLILILSIYKTKKGIEIFIKNVKRNFFLGFLSFNYKKQLIIELIQVGKGIIRVFKFIIICLFVIRIKATVIRLRDLYRIRKQKEKIKKQNQEIYKQTLKSGRQEKLSYISFPNFYEICKYLQPNDIYSLSKASKNMFIWTSQQDIWQQQWENKYQKISENPNKQGIIKDLVTESFKRQNRPKQIEWTYQSILDQELLTSWRQPFYINQFISPSKLIYPEYHGLSGFLNNDTQYEEIFILGHYTIFLPIDYIIWLILDVYGNRRYARVKQLSVILIILSVVTIFISQIFNNFYQIFLIDKWIGIKALLFIYLVLFFILFCLRISNIARQLHALIPFTIYYDAFDLLRYLQKKGESGLKIIENKIKKVLTYIGNILQKVLTYIGNLLTKVFTYIGSMFKKAVIPIYKFIYNVIVQVTKTIKMIFNSLLSAINLFLKGVFNILITIKNIVLGIGLGYLDFLVQMMNFFLKFGILGDLIFTFVAIAYLCLPLILSYFFYWKRIVIIPSLILTIIIFLKGYSALRKARQ